MTQNLFSEEPNNLLYIVRANFNATENITWQEMFEGYDTLKAITYSSSIDFICKLLPKFNTSEIIFGFEGILSYQMHEIIAYQTKTIKRIKENSSKNKIDLTERIDAGNLKLLVSRTQISHEKTYLLKSANNKYRVILGSANLSKMAFSGTQRENIIVMDSEEAYNHYLFVYFPLLGS